MTLRRNFSINFNLFHGDDDNNENHKDEKCIIIVV